MVVIFSRPIYLVGDGQKLSGLTRHIGWSDTGICKLGMLNSAGTDAEMKFRWKDVY